MKNITVRNLVSAGIILIFAVLCVRFIAFISSVLMIGVLALMFSAILNRPVSFLEKKGCNRTVAAVSVLLLILFIIGQIISVIIPEAVKETEIIRKKAPKLENEFEYKADILAKKLGFDLTEIRESEYLKNKFLELVPTLLTGVTKLGKNLLGALIHTILIILLMIYILSDPKPLIRGFLDPWNLDIKKKLRRCIFRTEIMMSAWAVGLFCGMLCMFLLTWLGLSVIKMEGAFLFAVIAGLMNIIPTLGPFLAAVLPLFIVSVISPVKAVWVLAVYIGMHQIESHILTPLIMKKQLSIHPMILILAILAMFFFFGMIGAFITAPVMAVFSIIYDEFAVKPRKLKNKN